MIYFLSFIFIIAIPVFLHELGHYMAARSVGIKVEKFYVGFNFFGLGIKKKYKDTEYGIGAFPLGGYVKVAGILDENLDSDNLETSEKKDYEFRSKNVFQKLWFLSAGVIMNFILSIVIFTGIFYMNGVSDIINEPIIGSVSENIPVFDENGKASEIPSPAYELGLMENDRILEINNYKINNWVDIGCQISSKPNSMVQIKWERNGSFFTDSVKVGIGILPEKGSIVEKGILGITAQTKHIDLTFFNSFGIASMRTLEIIRDTFYSFVGLITGDISFKYMSGIVGIVDIAGQTAQQEQAMLKLLFLMAYISANLGLINILPIPGLDGGHAALAIVEGIIRRDLPLNVKYAIQSIGFFLIMALFIFTIYNDLVKL